MFGQNPIRKQDLSRGHSLALEKVFHTVQGEGPFAGIPAVFVRLSGCNLACHWCWGWFKNSGRQPFVYMARGPKKKLGKIKVGDRILTLDDKGRLQPTTVKKVLRRSVDEWVRARIDGLFYYMTVDHPLFTNRGLVAARDLKVGDEILHCASNDVIAWKKLGERNPMKDPAVLERRVANTDWHAMGRKVADPFINNKKNGTYVSTWDTLSKKQRQAVRTKNSENRLGELNPNYNPDRPDRNYQELKNEVKQGLHSCERCIKNKGQLDVHHRDHDRGNDARNNLEVLCHSCHSVEHGVGHNWRRRENELHIRNGRQVESVQYVDDLSRPPSLRKGPLPVVNLSCAPYATYLADGMWSKNCDTQFETGIDNLHSPTEIGLAASQIHDTSICSLVVITGGEPLRQNIAPLCNVLVEMGYHVQIETAGTVWVPDLEFMVMAPHRFPVGIDPGVTIVVSPKTGKVHPAVSRNAIAWKYIINATDLFDDEDGLPNTSTQIVGHKQRLARPPDNTPLDRIYLQPCDMQDPEKNEANIRLAAALAMKHGYRVSIQQHKTLNLE